MYNRKYAFIISSIVIALVLTATACGGGSTESQPQDEASSATDSSIAQPSDIAEATDSSIVQPDDISEATDSSVARPDESDTQGDGKAYDSTAIADFPKNTVKSNHAEGFTDGELSDIVDRTEDGRFEEVARSFYADRGKFPVHSSLIYDAYTEGGKLKIFVLTAYIFYTLDNEYVTEQGGEIVPAAITYEVRNDGVAVLMEYMPPKYDGALLGKSIRAFCKMPVSGKKIPGLAKKMSNYSNDESLELHKQRLISYLKSLGLASAKFKKYAEDPATQLY